MWRKTPGRTSGGFFIFIMKYDMNLSETKTAEKEELP